MKSTAKTQNQSLDESVSLREENARLKRSLTEHKRAMAELRGAEQQFKSIFENANDAVIFLNKYGKIIDVNKKSTEIFGYKRDEVVGKHFTEFSFFQPTDLASIVQIFDQSSGHEYPWITEFEATCSNKSRVHVEVSASLILNDDDVEGIVCILRNITERKRAEKALRESEDRFRLIFENANDAIGLLDKQGVIIDANQKAVELFGYSREESIGRNYAELGVLEPDALRESIELFNDAFQKGYQSLTEAEIKRKNGSTVDVEISAKVIKKDGEPTGALFITRDVTDRKRVETALQASEAYYRLLAENMTDVIYTTDLELQLSYMSPSVEILLGYTPDEVKALGLEKLMTATSLETLRKDLSKHGNQVIIKTDGFVRPRVLEHESNCKDGTIIWAESVTKLLFDENGKPVGTIGTVRDISERKKAEDELQLLYKQERELREQVQEDMKRKIEFTRTLAHELKTPLTPILASVDSLVTELVEEPLLSLAQNIGRGARNLESRIDELLDLAKGEVGMLELNTHTVDLSQMLREAADSVGPVVRSGGQSLSVELPDFFPLVRADISRIQQVVLNLLENATKFTPKDGAIKLKAKEKDSILIIEVQDTGPGISNDDKERIFEPYRRLISDKGRLSGLGLGLALCKTLVELHGGEIWVKSRPGKGSTFGFSLPVEMAQRTAGLDKVGKLWKVLIVEDDPEIVDSITLACQMDWPEADLVSARTGEEGIEMVETEQPDIAILDLGLPDTDGFEVLRQIRLFSSIPVIILSVRGEETDIIKCLEWGADDYMTKPFRKKELLSRLKVRLHKQTPPDLEVPIIYGSLCLDPSTFQLTYASKDINLTVSEGRILQLLMRNTGGVVTHSRLAEVVWGEDYPRAIDSLRTYIRKLREKLEANPSRPKLILTKSGVGYSLAKPS